MWGKGAGHPDMLDVARSVCVALVLGLLLGCSAETGPVELTPRDVADILARFSALGPAIAARSREVSCRGADCPGIELPPTADGLVSLTDARSGVSIRFRMNDVAAAHATATEGARVYTGALPQADIVRQPLLDGVEDYFAFSARPDRAEVSYTVELTHVDGVRSVDDTVEFLDASGAPRLRVSPPWVMDALGVRTRAAVQLEGCAYDADGRALWVRPVVAPGSSTCTVRVRWGDVQYPALVDPEWTLTGSMSSGRYDFVLVPIENNTRALAIGGTGATSTGGAPEPLASAEIYQLPDQRAAFHSGSWAAAPKMGIGRTRHAAVVLTEGDGKGNVIVLGGSCCETPPCDCDSTAVEVWSPNTGMWAEQGHWGHLLDDHDTATATVVGGGKILVVGSTETAELYDPSTRTSEVVTQQVTARLRHSATLLPDGTVLVCGGLDAQSTMAPVKTCDLFGCKSPDCSDPTWRPLVGWMSAERAGHTATPLPDGSVLDGHHVHGGVLIAGGRADASAEICSVKKGMLSCDRVQNMSNSRTGHTATLRPSGNIVISGGLTGSEVEGPSQTTETYNPFHSFWNEREPMHQQRAYHAATVLGPGYVLVAGGRVDDTALKSSELFQPGNPGAPCKLGSECAGGNCVNNYCCDRVCDDPCEACSAALIGGPRDARNGTCAFIQRTDVLCSHDDYLSCGGAFHCVQREGEDGGVVDSSCKCDLKCADDADCASGWACRDEQCACTANWACGQAEVCSAVSGKCEAPLEAAPARSSCACTLPATPRDSSLGYLALIAALAWWTRQRRTVTESWGNQRKKDP